MGGNASRETGALVTDMGVGFFYIDGMSIFTRAYRNGTALFTGFRSIPRWRGPSVCKLCSQWCQDVICPDCLHTHASFVARCHWCALPCQFDLCQTCLHRPPVWQHVTAVLSYQSPWRELIIEYKFQHNAGLQRLWVQIIHSHPQAKALIQSADLLVPVPLSAQRLRERGFNQSQWLAKHLCRKRTQDNLLWRIRHTDAQTALNREERMHNLRHAVVVNPAASSQVVHKTVLLLDDVMTTGSTLEVCAKALLAAGADKVHCLVLARAAPDEAHF